MSEEFMDEIDRDLLDNGPGEQPHIRLAKSEQQVRELTATNRRLEAELEEARRDGERLDWLESLVAHEGIFGHSMQGRDLLCRSGGWTCGNNVLGGWFSGKTARAAIDAARGAK